jgi:hypothetical protein
METIRIKEKGTARRIIAVQNEMNRLLFHPTKMQVDKELLTITVLRTKAHNFNFLEGYTTQTAVGKWQTYVDEHNAVISIQFKDRKDEKVGLRLMRLLKLYNTLVVGEQLLYARTEPIEESTL